MLSLSCSRSALADALAFAFGAVERKTTIPILAHYRLSATDNTFTISATDLELAASIRVPAAIKSAGELTLPAKRLLDYVRALPGDEVTIAQGKNSWATVSCGKARSRIAGISAESFPAIPVAGATVATIKPQAFAGLVARVSSSISKEVSRFTLDGALLVLVAGMAEMVATDGHRLSRSSVAAQCSNGARHSATLPTKLLRLVPMLADRCGIDAEVAIGLDPDGRVSLTAGAIQATATALSGKFPDYQRVIPKNLEHRFTVAAAGLKSALARVSIFSDERSRAVKVAISGGEIRLAGGMADSGESEESVEISGTVSPVEIGVNASYLVDALEACQAAGVEIAYRDAQSAIRVAPAGDGASDTECIVMPMRV